MLVWISTSVNERVHRQVVVINRERFQRLLLRLGDVQFYFKAQSEIMLNISPKKGGGGVAE